MIDDESCPTLTARIGVYDVGGRLQVHDGEGVICAGVLDESSGNALLLLWDEGELNHGCALSNSVEPVLRHLRLRWGHRFAWHSYIAVERDSVGAFDFLRIGYPRSTSFQGWSPVLWPGCEPRSWAAVSAMFGPLAQKALFAVSRVGRRAAARPFDT